MTFALGGFLCDDFSQIFVNLNIYDMAEKIKKKVQSTYIFLFETLS